MRQSGTTDYEYFQHPYLYVVNTDGGRETLALSLFLVEARESLETT